MKMVCWMSHVGGSTEVISSETLLMILDAVFRPFVLSGSAPYIVLPFAVIAAIEKPIAIREEE